jgi:branched-chain amino acid aminotransferase
MYGKGVFTTIAVYDGTPFVWEKHWRRLQSNAAAVGIDLSRYSERQVRDSLDALIEHNDVWNGRARIMFYDGSSSPVWAGNGETKTGLLINTGDLRALPYRLQVTTSDYRVNSQSPLTAIKSCNYLENLMALDEARERGFDEAIRLNEKGEITAACMANIFWIIDGRIHTPTLDTGCLKGTTREFAMENVKCLEVKAHVEVLREADAIFLTSAGIGIAEIAEIDGRKLTAVPANIKDLIPQKNTKPRE